MESASPGPERIIFLEHMVSEGRQVLVAIPLSKLPSGLVRPLLRQQYKPTGRIIRKPKLLEAHRLLYKYNDKDEIDFVEIDEAACQAT